MRIISVVRLKAFWGQSIHRDSRQSLPAWVRVVKAARWADSPSIKAIFGSADILRYGRVAFNIGGNKYQIINQINYRYDVFYVRCVGMRCDHDTIDAQTV